jgi:hypothetical protein
LDSEKIASYRANRLIWFVKIISNAGAGTALVTKLQDGRLSAIAVKPNMTGKSTCQFKPENSR